MPPYSIEQEPEPRRGGWLKWAAGGVALLAVWQYGPDVVDAFSSDTKTTSKSAPASSSSSYPESSASPTDPAESADPENGNGDGSADGNTETDVVADEPENRYVAFQATEGYKQAVQVYDGKITNVYPVFHKPRAPRPPKNTCEPARGYQLPDREDVKPGEGVGVLTGPDACGQLIPDAHAVVIPTYTKGTNKYGTKDELFEGEDSRASLLYKIRLSRVIEGVHFGKEHPGYMNKRTMDATYCLQHYFGVIDKDDGRDATKSVGPNTAAALETALSQRKPGKVLACQI